MKRIYLITAAAILAGGLVVGMAWSQQPKPAATKPAVPVVASAPPVVSDKVQRDYYKAQADFLNAKAQATQWAQTAQEKEVPLSAV